jgi:hypothetical protein
MRRIRRLRGFLSLRARTFFAGWMICTFRSFPQPLAALESWESLNGEE